MSPQHHDLARPRLHLLEDSERHLLAAERALRDQLRTVRDELAAERISADDARDVLMRAVQETYHRPYMQVLTELHAGLGAWLGLQGSEKGATS